MARKVGQIIARGDRRWLIRVYLGRDHETKTRKYHNRTIHGSIRDAQAYLTRKLRERDLAMTWRGQRSHSTSTLIAGLRRCEATSPREDLSGLRWHAATVHPAQFRRNSSGYNAAYGRSDCLSENDRARAPPCGFQFTRLVLRPATHLDPTEPIRSTSAAQM